MDRQPVKNRALAAIGEKFSLVKGRGFDCMSFLTHCTEEHSNDLTNLPDFNAFSIGDKMYQLIMQEVQDRGIKEIQLSEAQAGDWLVMTRNKNRSPHAGIIVDKDNFAHCMRGTGVTLTPINDDNLINEGFTIKHIFQLRAKP